MKEDRYDKAAKLTQLATGEAKEVITKWAENMPTDDGKIGFVIIASAKMTADMIDAIIGLDEHVMAKRTLKQIEFLLLPQLEELRRRVKDGA